jgi:hypothetical protein
MREFAGHILMSRSTPRESADGTKEKRNGVTTTTSGLITMRTVMGGLMILSMRRTIRRGLHGIAVAKRGVRWGV